MQRSAASTNKLHCCATLTWASQRALTSPRITCPGTVISAASLLSAFVLRGHQIQCCLCTLEFRDTICLFETKTLQLGDICCIKWRRQIRGGGFGALSGRGGALAPPSMPCLAALRVHLIVLLFFCSGSCPLLILVRPRSPRVGITEAEEESRAAVHIWVYRPHCLSIRGMKQVRGGEKLLEHQSVRIILLQRVQRRSISSLDKDITTGQLQRDERFFSGQSS